MEVIGSDVIPCRTCKLPHKGRCTKTLCNLTYQVFDSHGVHEKAHGEGACKKMTGKDAQRCVHKASYMEFIAKAIAYKLIEEKKQKRITARAKRIVIEDRTSRHGQLLLMGPPLRQEGPCSRNRNQNGYFPPVKKAKKSTYGLFYTTQTQGARDKKFNRRMRKQRKKDQAKAQEEKAKQKAMVNIARIKIETHALNQPYKPHMPHTQNTYLINIGQRKKPPKRHYQYSSAGSGRIFTESTANGDQRPCALAHKTNQAQITRPTSRGDIRHQANTKAGQKKREPWTHHLHK
jgi:hypothetical protein